MECGVTQGSCCSPVLFNVYVSTLDDYITDVNKQGYTDDHDLYTSFNTNNRDEEHLHSNAGKFTGKNKGMDGSK